MSLEDGQKLYTLKHKLMYKAKGGTTEQAKFLELREPKASHARNYMKIEQMVSGVTIQSGLKFSQMGIDKDSIISGGEVKTLADVDPEDHDSEAHKFAEMMGYFFGLSDDLDLQANYVETFQKMACNSRQSSLCIVDGEIPMSDAIWQEMDPRDMKGVAVLWGAFFTMPAELANASESGNPSE